MVLKYLISVKTLLVFCLNDQLFFPVIDFNLSLRQLPLVCNAWRKTFDEFFLVHPATADIEPLLCSDV